MNQVTKAKRDVPPLFHGCCRLGLSGIPCPSDRILNGGRAFRRGCPLCILRMHRLYTLLISGVNFSAVILLHIPINS